MKWLRRHGSWLASLCLALWLMPQLAHAEMIYERKRVTIYPALSELAESSVNEKPLPPREPVVYDIELRGEDALRLEYIHALNILTPTNGVMIALNAPAMLPLPSMNVFTPVDVLFIADDGTILQIMPNVTLGELTENAEAKSPIKAFLFLKAGQVAARAISPRDRARGSMFNRPLTIQE